MEGSSHYLGDKQDFDVSPFSKRRNLVYCLGSETILP